MKTVSNLLSYLSIYSGVTLTAIRWLGQWTGLVPLPVKRTFESLAATLEGDDKEMFLSFIQCYVRWLPEERLKPIEGYMHPFLRGGELPDSFD